MWVTEDGKTENAITLGFFASPEESIMEIALIRKNNKQNTQ
jgi:hypothetical protein